MEDGAAGNLGDLVMCKLKNRLGLGIVNILFRKMVEHAMGAAMRTVSVQQAVSIT